MIKLFLNFLIIFFLAQNLNSEEIYGNPKIIDGDTVHINSKKIRLEGIDAPEMRQQCQIVFLKISPLSITAQSAGECISSKSLRTAPFFHNIMCTKLNKKTRLRKRSWNDTYTW